MLKIGQCLVNNGVVLSIFAESDTAWSKREDVIDVGGSVWIGDGEVVLSPFHVNFSHVEHTGLSFLDHEASPVTDKLSWCNMAAFLVAGVIGESGVVGLFAFQSLVVA